MVARRAIDALQDWRVVNQTQNTASDDSSTGSNVKWQKPPGSMLKCNIDAPLFPEKKKNQFGYGVCLRDEQGQLI